LNWSIATEMPAVGVAPTIVPKSVLVDPGPTISEQLETPQTKPALAAPGANMLSALPRAIKLADERRSSFMAIFQTRGGVGLIVSNRYAN
jgi:hypothetical protein